MIIFYVVHVPSSLRKVFSSLRSVLLSFVPSAFSFFHLSSLSSFHLVSFLFSFFFCFLPSFLPFFLPSFLSSFLPFFLPSFLPFFLPSFLSSFLFSFLPCIGSFLFIIFLVMCFNFFWCIFFNASAHSTTTMLGCELIFCRALFHWVRLCVFARPNLTIATPDWFDFLKLKLNPPLVHWTRGKNICLQGWTMLNVTLRPMQRPNEQAPCDNGPVRPKLSWMVAKIMGMRDDKL